MTVNEIVVAGTYQSHKGDLYEVQGMAEEPPTGKKFVVYVSLGVSENLSDPADPENPVPGQRLVRNGSKGALAVADVGWFTAEVDKGVGAKVPRFRLLSAVTRR